MFLGSIIVSAAACRHIVGFTTRHFYLGLSVVATVVAFVQNKQNSLFVWRKRAGNDFETISLRETEIYDVYQAQ